MPIPESVKIPEAPKPKVEPPKPLSPQPKSSWYRVRSGHDWGCFEATSQSEAESRFRDHFGITGSAHRFEVSNCDENPSPWHSGQQIKR